MIKLDTIYDAIINKNAEIKQLQDQRDDLIGIAMKTGKFKSYDDFTKAFNQYQLMTTIFGK